MANTAENLFSKYVESKLEVKLSDGNVLNFLVTPRDKMKFLKAYAGGKDSFDQMIDVAADMIFRSYPAHTREEIYACVVMENEEIFKKLLFFFQLITAEEYTERRDRMLGREPVKKNDTGGSAGGVPAQTHDEKEVGDGGGSN